MSPVRWVSYLVLALMMLTAMPPVSGDVEEGAAGTRASEVYDERNMIYEESDSALDFSLPNVLFEPEGRIDGVTTGDIDGDGDQDVLVCYGGPYESTIGLWENPGSLNGDWKGLDIDTVIGHGPILNIADMDGDGLNDLVVIMGGSLYIYHNEGTPWTSWPEPVEDFEHGGGYNAQILDLDGDGDLDIVLAGDLTITVLLNSQTDQGNFTPLLVGHVQEDTYEIYEEQIQDMAIGDYDGDGDYDIVTVNRVYPDYGYNVTLWLNDGLYSNETEWEFWEVDSFGLAVVSGSNYARQFIKVLLDDFDGDGYLDILSADSPGEYYIWKGTGRTKAPLSRTFLDDIWLRPDKLERADLDLDGDLDLAVVGPCECVYVVENRGDPHNPEGWLNHNAGEMTIDFIGYLVVADMDGDGLKDLVSADYQRDGESNRVIVYANLVDDPVPTKDYSEIYAYLGTAPAIDGSMTGSDGWDQTPTSVSSFVDGDIRVKVKHNGTYIFFCMQWTDTEGYDSRFSLYFEDDGTDRDGILDSENEDFKYGDLEPDGADPEWRDGTYGGGWPVDSTFTNDPCYFGSTLIDGTWTFEGAFELCSGDDQDINVTGNETLGFMFSKGCGDGCSPTSSYSSQGASGWADLHVVFYDGHSDLDGVFDCCDAFPLDSDEWSDLDGDGVGDNEDLDDDGDGHPDGEDAFPEDPEEWADTDGDGVGDNEDAFPEDPADWRDTDGDGVGDNTDEFPGDPTETRDTDGDGVGDNADAFPTDPTVWADADGDGYGDRVDEFPEDPLEWSDTDGDGVGDNADAFPTDPTEWSDNDGDLIGDESDPDDDDDGYEDWVEIAENTSQWNASSTPDDFDGDLIPDSTDDDIDGDGVPDDVDDDPYTVPDMPNDDPPSRIPLLIAIVLAVVITVVILVLLLVLRKERIPKY